MGVGGVGSSRGVDYGDTVFTDKKNQGVTADDFLKLMVAQFQNQDFMNPVDDTQYIAQLAQFATMEQMTQMASFAKQSYVMSLVGQTVTAAKFKVNGEIDSVTGRIDRISLLDNEYLIYIGDKSFSLDQIMELGGKPSTGDSGNDIDYGKSSFLFSLVGKNVTVKKGEDEEITGVVDKVTLDGGMKMLIGGEWYTLDKLVSAQPGEDTPETGKPDGGQEG